jgi:hypothetical protein
MSYDDPLFPDDAKRLDRNIRRIQQRQRARESVDWLVAPVPMTVFDWMYCGLCLVMLAGLAAVTLPGNVYRLAGLPPDTGHELLGWGLISIVSLPVLCLAGAFRLLIWSRAIRPLPVLICCAITGATTVCGCIIWLNMVVRI